MPIGAFINVIPGPVFILVHAVALVIGVYFARRSFALGARDFGRAFVLFALAELSYVTYHLDWTTFLFAHLISEVLDLLAFIFVFMGLTKRTMGGAGSPAGGR
jgi:hypothetical protein